MRILCTNDDGYLAKGLGVLSAAAKSLGEVHIVAREGFPGHTLLNVSLPAVPPDEVRGIKVTSLGQRRYSDSITKALDPKGKEYSWIGGEISAWTGGDDADYLAVREGFISVTPLHLDLTNYRLLEEIRGWNLAL